MCGKTVDKYKQDGVDIEVGDQFSKFAGKIARGSYNNSPFVTVHDLSQGNFRGPRGFTLHGLPPGCITTGSVDGVGTKVVVIDAARGYRNAANDLIGMTAMDITRFGGLPLILFNILDVSTLGEPGSKTFHAAAGLMTGLAVVAEREGYVIFTGETAELGKCVGSENENADLKFNWGGTMLGAYHPDKMILGNSLKAGQTIIALGDHFRSNGISSVRKALACNYGREYWDNPEAKNDLIACATPSCQYDRMLNEAHGWLSMGSKPLVKMHLIVHLSGGAFESKLGKDILTPLGLSARFDNLFEPPPIMRDCAKWRGMTPAECYRTWNGGQGVIVVVDRKSEDDLLRIAKRYGVRARVAGEIVKKIRVKGKEYNLSIVSKFGRKKIFYL